MYDMSQKHKPECQQRELLEQLFSTTTLTTFELFRNFPVFTPRYNLARFIAHYELFKKVVHLPGVIVDVGVCRGASTFTWAKLCEIFCPTDVRKIVYGFDTFKGFPGLTEADGRENRNEDVQARGYYGGDTIERDLDLARQAMNVEKHIKHINRVELIKGDVAETIPKFIQDKGNGLRIVLMNLDVDLYEPTKTALTYFVPLMVRGGIIILDEYAVDTFGGESKAVDEYFKKQFGIRPILHKFTWHSNPSAYIEVEW